MINYNTFLLAIIGLVITVGSMYAVSQTKNSIVVDLVDCGLTPNEQLGCNLTAKTFLNAGLRPFCLKVMNGGTTSLMVTSRSISVSAIDDEQAAGSLYKSKFLVPWLKGCVYGSSVGGLIAGSGIYAIYKDESRFSSEVRTVINVLMASGYVVAGLFLGGCTFVTTTAYCFWKARKNNINVDEFLKTKLLQSTPVVIYPGMNIETIILVDKNLVVQNCMIQLLDMQGTVAEVFDIII